MKNVTITVEDSVLDWARIEAARRGSIGHGRHCRAAARSGAFALGHNDPSQRRGSSARFSSLGFNYKVHRISV